MTTYKREAAMPDKVQAFNSFWETLETLVEAGIDQGHFLNWFGEQLKEYIGKFAQVQFDEQKRLFGKDIEDMPRKAKVVIVDPDNQKNLVEWNQLAPQASAMRDREQALRTAIVLGLFTTDKLTGVETIDIGYGYKLKADKSENVSVVNDVNKVNELLALIWTIPEIQEIATRLITWSPSVSIPAYRDLVKASEAFPSLKVLMAAMFTVKPGMPTLEMIAPPTPVTIEQTGQPPAV